MRNLRRRPHRELPTTDVVVGHDAASFHGVWDQSLVDDSLAHNDIGGGSSSIEVARAYAPGEGLVAVNAIVYGIAVSRDCDI